MIMDIINVGKLKSIIAKLPDDLFISINNGKVVIEDVARINPLVQETTTPNNNKVSIIIPTALNKIYPREHFGNIIAHTKEFIDAYISNNKALSGKCMYTTLNGIVYKACGCNGAKTDDVLKKIIEENKSYIEHASN